jgi:hypothetical protein
VRHLANHLSQAPEQSFFSRTLTLTPKHRASSQAVVADLKRSAPSGVSFAIECGPVAELLALIILQLSTRGAAIAIVFSVGSS